MLRRKVNSNKSDFGHIFILAGSVKFLGAAQLCAESALRSGAGLVTLGVPESLKSTLLKIKPKEVMILPLAEDKKGYFGVTGYKKLLEFLKKIDVLVIGPGLALERSTKLLVRNLVKTVKLPLVIDADGLNALTGYLEYLKQGTIITPHPGEMARLIKKSVIYVQSNRKEVAKSFAKRHKIILVLKGNHTLVSNENGILFINKTGNPGMATAGSGDVLTGMIAAFLGQGLNAFASAKYAVYLHGLAGDLGAKEKTQISLIASDIIDKIPYALRKNGYLPA
ncbi:MAG: NAD(P)H-hydrate dehydratase [Candidatus Omnitrophica bacterium]|nr:NAD(P)H-hydrate dehydratase [Candidatus Omnitrophota bacterium]